MENFWGFQWQRLVGMVLCRSSVNSNWMAIRTKTTYGTEDGTTVNGYNLTGEGYSDDGSGIAGGTNGGYIAQMYFDSDKLFRPRNINASQGQHYCSACWFYNGAANNEKYIALVGGNSVDGARVGVVFWCLDSPASYTNWSFGASLSLKPLEEEDAEVVT